MQDLKIRDLDRCVLVTSEIGVEYWGAVSADQTHLGSVGAIRKGTRFNEGQIWAFMPLRT